MWKLFGTGSADAPKMRLIFCGQTFDEKALIGLGVHGHLLRLVFALTIALLDYLGYNRCFEDTISNN